MDYLTQELIEKYKSEMQKMISNVKSLNERMESQIQQSQMQPAQAQPPQTQPPQTQPPQNQAPAEIQQGNIQEFPRFESDSDGLRLRIEEILRQNSEVTTSDDYPSPRGEGYQAEQSQTPQGTQNQQLPQATVQVPQNQQTAQMQNLPSDPAFETPPPPMQFQSGNADQSQNEITFENQAPVPSAEPSAPPMTDAQMDENETQQQTVSRTCIRGGARAQYSPPANTGSSLQSAESENPALSGVARLRVETFAANRAYPVSNAVIRIKNPADNSLVAVLVTNEDGLTESVDLPAPSGSLSQTPEFPDPFFNYNVDIRAEGYTPRENLNAQVFGGIDSLISANLVPEEPLGRSGENG